MFCTPSPSPSPTICKRNKVFISFKPINTQHLSECIFQKQNYKIKPIDVIALIECWADVTETTYIHSLRRIQRISRKSLQERKKTILVRSWEYFWPENLCMTIYSWTLSLLRLWTATKCEKGPHNMLWSHQQNFCLKISGAVK